LRHVQEREESERRILKLELENHLLRVERDLPPQPPLPDEPQTKE
jgi:hypothetical protein